jgi:hypothetical protein
MSILNRLPWLSLVLVILTFSHLGWVISKANVLWFVWLVVGIAIFLLQASLTPSWARIAAYFGIIFKSDSRTFAFAVLSALLFFIMIARFRLFLDTLVIIAATILARIDFQTGRFSQAQAFWITFFFSLTSLALGALAAKFISSHWSLVISP